MFYENTFALSTVLLFRLVVRKISVRDILSEESCKPHTLTLFARVVGDTITYPKVSPEKMLV